MTSGLKTTIIASTGLAVMLNLVQFTVNFNRSSRDALADSTAVAPAKPRTVGKTTAIVKATPSPAPVAMAAQTAPAITTDPAADAAAKLAAAGLSPVYAPNYLSVQAQTGTPWQLLAAVHRIETGQSGDTGRRSYAGATGPMQFMPATFAHYALDGDGDGRKVITDLDDALLSAGNYLRAGGADKGKYNQALYNYNHSTTYVANVMRIARQLGLK